MLTPVLKRSTISKTVQIATVFNPKSSGRKHLRTHVVGLLHSFIHRHISNPTKNSAWKTDTPPSQSAKEFLLENPYIPTSTLVQAIMEFPFLPNSSSSANGYKKPHLRCHPQKLTRVTGNSPNILSCRVTPCTFPT